MTIQERYEEIRKTCNNRERIFQHVGIPKNDSSGGWVSRPRIDHANGGIPLIEKFAIMPKNAQQRLNDLEANGWREFVPQSTPEGVKRVVAVSGDAPKTRSSRKKSR